MYHIVYGLLYLFSLLPFFILYAFSDFACFIIYNVAGYRKNVVLGNLDIAFPEKSSEEKKKIAKKFYRNLTDTFVETIKLISMSEKTFLKRVQADVSICNEVAAKGKNLQLHSGHQMNWEYGHLIMAKKLSLPWIGIYMPIQNKTLNRIFYKIRNKHNAIMVSTYEFKSRMHNLFGKQYALGLVADQNPAFPKKSYWINFFTKPAPFISVPDKLARRNNSAIIFINFIRYKRGYYRYVPTLITENGNELEHGELAIKFRDFLEKSIREAPDNYLWSHRRWKWPFDESLKSLWIDNRKPGVVDALKIIKEH